MKLLSFQLGSLDNIDPKSEQYCSFARKCICLSPVPFSYILDMPSRTISNLFTDNLPIVMARLSNCKNGSAVLFLSFPSSQSLW